MNITENLQRIKQGKDDIIKSLKNKGVEISDNTLINEIPTIIDNAEIGGGGDTPIELVPKYEGATVFRINVPTDNYEFAINLCNDATKATYDVDWGDGSLESGLTTDEQHHTYSKSGTYDVNIYNISKDITLGGKYSINGFATSGSNIVSLEYYYLFNNSNNDEYVIGKYIQNSDIIVTDVLIGNNVSLVKETFYTINTLQSIVLNDGMKTIVSNGFQGCNRLNKVVIPETVTNIGNSAFTSCSSLKNIKLPNSLQTITISAFNRCSGLESIDIPNSVTTIGNSAFSNCTSLQSVKLSENITLIDSSTFEYCERLRYISVPESVVSIGNSAFVSCYNLQRILLPTNINSIGSSAFQNCSSLQNIEIPKLVNSLSNSVFTSCYSLQSITCLNPTAPTITSSTFPTSSFKYTKRYLYVPKDSVGYDDGNWKSYLIDKGWELRYIEDYPKTPTTLKLKTTNNFLHDFKAIGQANLINYELINDEYIYYFDDKITELHQYTFYNKVLEEIELPEGLEIIGNYVFGSCSNLTSVTIPDSVTSIGQNVFNSCKSLQNITIPKNVETIGQSCFGDCSSLQSVIIYGGISKIEQNTFVRCSNLETLELPSTLTNIGGNSFKQTNRLTAITCKAITAPTISSNSFDSIGTNVPSGTKKVLRVPEGATGYDEGYWKSTVIDKGFTIEYIPIDEL